MIRRVIATTEFNPDMGVSGVGVGKPSPNRAIGSCNRPETSRSTPEQGESRRNAGGGPNHLVLKNHWMTWG
jgi:hypothetical protein